MQGNNGEFGIWIREKEEESDDWGIVLQVSRDQQLYSTIDASRSTRTWCRQHWLEDHICCLRLELFTPHIIDAVRAVLCVLPTWCGRSILISVGFFSSWNLVARTTDEGEEDWCLLASSAPLGPKWTSRESTALSNLGVKLKLASRLKDMVADFRYGGMGMVRMFRPDRNN